MRIKEQFHYNIMMLPGILWIVFFSLVPMAGIIIAFEQFDPGLGMFGSKIVGLENFRYIFSIQGTRRLIFNTLFIALSKIVLNLVVPLVFALLLNEVRNHRFKRISQTIVYLPNFISWVILASIFLNMFGYFGVVNTVCEWFGQDRRVFMQDGAFARNLVIITDVWKGFGYGAIIYLAALTGINPELYEAAAIDGAGRWKSTLAITLPGLYSTIALLGVLSLGGVLNAGFDQIFNLYNPLVYSTIDILDTWLYRMTFQHMDFSLGTAMGLLKSLVSFILIIVSYTLAYKFVGYRVF